jgi:hypothetical protein
MTLMFSGAVKTHGFEEYSRFAGPSVRQIALPPASGEAEFNPKG